MPVRREPLSFYVSRIERGEPFASVLVGDGELLVAGGERVGGTVSHYRESVTWTFVNEMRLALTDPGLFVGTDPHFVEPETYLGQDVASVQHCHSMLESVFPNCREREWFDGVVWDVVSRNGELGPLISALRRRDVALISNARLRDALGFLRFRAAATVPDENACGAIDAVEREALTWRLGEAPVVVVCCGLSAVPLIVRLRAKMPGATFLDLGSALDIFAGIGAERGWRELLYSTPRAREALVAKHLEGLA